MNQEHDEPLSDGLDHLPPGSFDRLCPPAALRAALLARTSGIVRSRARWRRVAATGRLAAAYAAGLATAFALLSSGREGDAPGKVAAPAAPSPAVAATPDDPEVLRRVVASAAPEDQPRLLRRAGDAYLEGRGDLVAALDCYRQAFEVGAPAPEGTTETEGSWLYAALRAARASEERKRS